MAPSRIRSHFSSREPPAPSSPGKSYYSDVGRITPRPERRDRRKRPARAAKLAPGGNWGRIPAVTPSESMANERFSADRTAQTKRHPLTWEADEIATRDRRLSLEWLETDGFGGFACGT